MPTTAYSFLLRYIARIVCGLCVAVSLAATSAPCWAEPPTPAQLVDALNGVFGAKPLTRANHANGLLLKATFRPDPAAAAVTKAIHFQSTSTPVTLRFSNFGGYPRIEDADPGAAPYGMSVKFPLPDGSETDIVMHSFNGFPARTAEEFREFLIAMARSPAGGSHPTALETYAATHEQAKLFLDAPKPSPASFTSQSYFGVNTFTFTNAHGKARFGRYRFIPVGGARYLDLASNARPAPDYLRAEILRRIALAPVQMKLQLQLSQQGDALDDPSIAWPEQRPLVELGTLSIYAAMPDSEAVEKRLVFFPDDLPAGIEAHDPMLKARTKAYAESFERRQH